MLDVLVTLGYRTSERPSWVWGGGGRSVTSLAVCRHEKTEREDMGSLECTRQTSTKKK